MGNTKHFFEANRHRTVHPHTHGEHAELATSFNFAYGSSPHAWGTLSAPGEEGGVDRFIPTRMGNTPNWSALQQQTPVHPHTHGEHFQGPLPGRIVYGSSPHAWGTPADQRAGSRQRPVHPHTHGEHHRRFSCLHYPYGSSPHAWGTQAPAALLHGSLRFIPTRMGNTCRPPRRQGVGSVHPHTHGEHASSPVRTACATRFIPTRMGNTSLSVWCVTMLSVHPHTHGEHETAATRALAYLGSSPHAWGTLRKERFNLHRPRFIPTRMGNTFCESSEKSVLTVHPHTHGEHVLRILRKERFNGSSPHAWGTQYNAEYNEDEYRFIPTRMGNTPPRRGAPGVASVHPHTHGEHGEPK